MSVLCIIYKPKFNGVHSLTNRRCSCAYRVLKLTDRGGHLPPLQHRLLGDVAIGVNIDALILVTQQQLHPTAAGEDDDGMRPNQTWDLRDTDILL